MKYRNALIGIGIIIFVAILAYTQLVRARPAVLSAETDTPFELETIDPSEREEKKKIVARYLQQQVDEGNLKQAEARRLLESDWENIFYQMRE